MPAGDSRSRNHNTTWPGVRHMRRAELPIIHTVIITTIDPEHQISLPGAVPDAATREKSSLQQNPPVPTAIGARALGRQIDVEPQKYPTVSQ